MNFRFRTTNRIIFRGSVFPRRGCYHIQHQYCRKLFVVKRQFSVFGYHEDEDHEKFHLPKQQGGNKTTYSQLYKTKKIKKHNKTFWKKYKNLFSSIVLGTAGIIGVSYLLFLMYDKLSKKRQSQLEKKIATTKENQKILDEISKEIALKYILPQFNKHIDNDTNIQNGFKHINRFSLELSQTIIHQKRCAWNFINGFHGCGITSLLKNSYNLALTNVRKEINSFSPSSTHSERYQNNMKNKQFLYLNFQEINSKLNCLQNLIKYQWNSNEFNMDDYHDRIPSEVSEYDLLRISLLKAIDILREKGTKQPIILIIDSIDTLIKNDVNFDKWLQCLGSECQQRRIAIISLENSFIRRALIGGIEPSHHGVTATNEQQVIRFFSENEIYNILKLNLINNDINYKLLASSLYSYTLGYPRLLADIIIDINNSDDNDNDNELYNNIISSNSNRNELMSSWFNNWYENVYIKNYMIKSIQILAQQIGDNTKDSFKIQLKETLQQTKQLILMGKIENESESKTILKRDDDNIDITIVDQVISLMYVMNSFASNNFGQVFPEYVCEQNDFKHVLPVMQEYWKTHTVNHIHKKMIDFMNI